MSEDIAARVKKVTADVLKINESEIQGSSRFMEDLGAASIQSIELSAAFEDEFDIDMDDEQAMGIKTIDGAVKYISELLAGS